MQGWRHGRHPLSVARAAVGTAFVTLGWEALLEPGGRVAKAAALGVPRPELATGKAPAAR